MKLLHKNLSNQVEKPKTEVKKSTIFLTEIALHPDFGGIRNQYFGKPSFLHALAFCWDETNANVHFKMNYFPFEMLSGHPVELKNHELIQSDNGFGTVKMVFIFLNSRDGKLDLDWIQRVEEFSWKVKEENSIDSKWIEKRIDKIVLDSNIKKISTLNLDFDCKEKRGICEEQTFMKDGIRISLKRKMD